jgi:small-conductance mechanosensitive channel
MPIKKLIIFVLLAAISGILWFAQFYYTQPYLSNVFYSFLILTFLYGIFKVGLEKFARSKIKEAKSRYSFRKTVGIIYVTIFLLTLFTIWLPNIQTLMVAYGLLAAGIAIALQDLLKNIAGGLSVLVSRPFRVGDRIEIKGKAGDVIDINLLSTTIMEMGSWVAGDQATGRLSVVPNGIFLSHSLDNYTKDHNFIWDEIVIPLSYGSDWKKAQLIMKDIVTEQTTDVAKSAKQALSRLQEKYYLSVRPTEPAVFLSFNENWITITVRYITEARQRRALKHILSTLVLEAISKDTSIVVATSTLGITALPEISLKKK